MCVILTAMPKSDSTSGLILTLLMQWLACAFTNVTDQLTAGGTIFSTRNAFKKAAPEGAIVFGKR